MLFVGAEPRADPRFGVLGKPEDDGTVDWGWTLIYG